MKISLTVPLTLLINFHFCTRPCVWASFVRFFFFFSLLLFTQPILITVNPMWQGSKMGYEAYICVQCRPTLHATKRVVHTYRRQQGKQKGVMRSKATQNGHFRVIVSIPHTATTTLCSHAH
uniref:Uncharacterized protein n=1 Tax=Trypanosoma vivax (strain Y486) TaxID=1055687 RepID=G0TYB6_TRYVY|nr:hypothetical protein, unlikely [Trypanosoma vivax Y486]